MEQSVTCKCGNRIYQAVVNPNEYEETGNLIVGWTHSTVPSADNPIEAAITLDNDHVPIPEQR